MSIEFVPTLACNLKCTYCYQDPMRDAGNIGMPWDWEAAKKALLKENYKFSVFGGEPLLTPINRLEEIFKFGYDNFRSKVQDEESPNAIQTNGTLITDAHIALFKKYEVGVGVSVDGPDTLNDARFIESIEETRKATESTLLNIEKLCRASIYPSIIVTLTKYNTGFEELEKLCDWFNKLSVLGVCSINIHFLETEPGREKQALTDAENMRAIKRIYEFSKTCKIPIKPFTDIRRLLLQEQLDKVSCIWNACDSLTTNAVHGVSADGTRTNCGRTNKDGVNWIKSDVAGFERYLLLHQTPQEYGGCKDCRFFAFCKGQCPGTAIDNDWRNRTVHCRVWYSLFETIERDIVGEARLPISRNSTGLRALEEKLLSGWRAGIQEPSEHGDAHGDIPHGDVPHGDAHGDAPHGDFHGDSNSPFVGGVAVTWKD